MSVLLTTAIPFVPKNRATLFSTVCRTDAVAVSADTNTFLYAIWPVPGALYELVIEVVDPHAEINNVAINIKF